MVATALKRMNFMHFKILTLFFKSIYLYIYFPYLTTFKIRELLFKYSKYQRSDLHSSRVWIVDFYFESFSSQVSLLLLKYSFWVLYTTLENSSGLNVTVSASCKRSHEVN